MTESKPWHKSRTVLAGIAVVVIEVLGYLGEAGVFEGLGLSAATATTARNWTRLLSIILGVAIVRFRTGVTKTIEGSRAAKQMDTPSKGAPS